MGMRGIAFCFRSALAASMAALLRCTPSEPCQSGALASDAVCNAPCCLSRLWLQLARGLLCLVLRSISSALTLSCLRRSGDHGTLIFKARSINEALDQSDMSQHKARAAEHTGRARSHRHADIAAVIAAMRAVQHTLSSTLMHMTRMQFLAM